MSENSTNMNFSDYYDSLKTKYIELKNQLCQEFGISDKTFYNKKNRIDGNDFDDLQKKRIAELTGIKREILFPESTHEKVA